jgi:putative peptide zinc metalloprotease protein
VLRAPFDGVVAERKEGIAVSQWVAPEQMLFHLVSPGSAVINGFVAERESARLAAGAAARFVADDGASAAVTAHLTVVGNPGGAGPAVAYLSARHGGPILTAPDTGNGRDSPVQGYLPVILAADGRVPVQALRGQAVVEAAPQSLLGFAFGRVVTVVLRESGF